MDKCVGPDFFQLRQITACRSWGFCTQVPGRKTESETKKEHLRQLGEAAGHQRGAAAEQSRAEGAERELFTQAPHARPIR